MEILWCSGVYELVRLLPYRCAANFECDSSSDNYDIMISLFKLIYSLVHSIIRPRCPWLGRLLLQYIGPFSRYIWSHALLCYMYNASLKVPLVLWQLPVLKGSTNLWKMFPWPVKNVSMACESMKVPLMHLISDPFHLVSYKCTYTSDSCL
jgi:hypothetical protein